MQLLRLSVAAHSTMLHSACVLDNTQTDQIKKCDKTNLQVTRQPLQLPGLDRYPAVLLLLLLLVLAQVLAVALAQLFYGIASIYVRGQQ
jgi:hypothetical protein